MAGQVAADSKLSFHMKTSGHDVGIDGNNSNQLHSPKQSGEPNLLKGTLKTKEKELTLLRISCTMLMLST